MTIMSVPEASMYKNNTPARGENKIRLSGKSCIVQFITKSLSVQGMTYQELRLCVLAANAGHHPAASLCVNDINHKVK
jgi:hypothetical protein